MDYVEIGKIPPRSKSAMSSPEELVSHNHSDFYRYVLQTFYADTIRFGLKFIFSSI